MSGLCNLSRLLLVFPYKESLKLISLSSVDIFISCHIVIYYAIYFAIYFAIVLRVSIKLCVLIHREVSYFRKYIQNFYLFLFFSA